MTGRLGSGPITPGPDAQLQKLTGPGALDHRSTASPGAATGNECEREKAGRQGSFQLHASIVSHFIPTFFAALDTKARSLFPGQGRAPPETHQKIADI